MKIYEQRQGPRKRSRFNNLVKWVVQQTYKASKLAFSDINRNRKLGRSPRSPYVGVATGMLKTPSTQLKPGKNDTALLLVLNTFKITTFLHLEHKSIMTECLFYNCIRYRNAKTRQKTRSN